MTILSAGSESVNESGYNESGYSAESVERLLRLAQLGPDESVPAGADAFMEWLNSDEAIE